MCDTKPGISLYLTLAQGDLMVEGLAGRPFRQVFELIGQLHQQAAGADPERVHFTLTHAQLRLVLEVLGELPFNRVQRLLHSMHGQIEAWRAHADAHAEEASLSEN
jgi:hypothetical protein